MKLAFIWQSYFIVLQSNSSPFQNKTNSEMCKDEFSMDLSALVGSSNTPFS